MAPINPGSPIERLPVGFCYIWGMRSSPDAKELIKLLQLEPHPEGGFYARTYDGGGRPAVPTEAGPRPPLTSIYYLLTQDSPIGHFHCNKSDILHFWQAGDPIQYYLIDPETRNLTEVTLGPDLAAGQQLQLAVSGGIWKASTLLDNTPKGTAKNSGFGLISEAVSPGFEYADMTLGVALDLLGQFPEYKNLIPKLSGA